MLLKGINGSALTEKELLVVVDNAEIQRKALLTDGSGRASFELDTSGWRNRVSVHVRDSFPLRHMDFGKDHRVFYSLPLTAFGLRAPRASHDEELHVCNSPV